MKSDLSIPTNTPLGKLQMLARLSADVGGESGKEAKGFVGLCCALW
jgi:hypothetical protein